MEPTGDSAASSDRQPGNKVVVSAVPVKPNGKPISVPKNPNAAAAHSSANAVVASAVHVKPNGKSVSVPMIPNATAALSSAGAFVASAAPAKPNGKSIASSVIVKSAVSSAVPVEPNADVEQVMFFRDVAFGPHEAVLMFRLIHFWEARNPISKTLIGQEMLFIDEEGTVIQGFIPAGRVGSYDLLDGTVYKLRNFFGSRNKTQYRVSDHIATVTFTWNSALSVVENPPVVIPSDRFRFHGYEEFRVNCDSKGDLYDYVGHMKLVNGQIISDHMVLDEVDIAEKRHLCVHVQTNDGPVMKLYIWDNAASEFCQKFKSYGVTPSVLLVTTVNPKHLGGTLCITSMSSSRVFMDDDVQPSKDYLEWLNANSDIANRVAAEIVTKPETVTLRDIFSYIKQRDSKVAWFECTATIDDFAKGCAWYYISCDGCNSKAVKGPTSLFCNNKKCGKSEVTGVPQYLTKVAVYDESELAAFVILGEAGRELTGKHAAELVAKYFETNDGLGADHLVPVPKTLLDTIGQTRRFIVKVSEHNLSGKTQTLTVTKILPLESPQPIANLGDGVGPAMSGPVLKTGGGVSGSYSGLSGAAGDMVRKAPEILESCGAKRPKSG